MGSRILLIEDNPDNLELMRYLLEAFGHSPLIAQDGAEGLQVARREIPDLIVCDIQLPVMNGYQVAQALGADRFLARIPRVAVTALAMVGDRERILAAGFDGYVSKPIVPEMFQKQIEAFLPGAPAPPEPVAVSPAPAPNVPPPPSKGVRILVVDNTPANIALARGTFEPLGYEVLEASNAADAMALALQFPPDLILSDVNMPEASGFDFFAAVKADLKLRVVPFAFISASGFVVDNIRQKCLALGADTFISRPVDPNKLVSEIESILNSVRKNLHGDDSGG